MAEKYLNIDLNDERTGKIAEVLANKTAKRILLQLADKEMSVSEIAQELKIPLNTADYNIKNLINTGLIERSKNFFWSIKGKKILTYRVSNKKIVISPKISFRGLIPAILISGLLALGIKIYSDYSGTEIRQKASVPAEAALSAAQTGYDVLVNTENAWLWFLSGALIALIIFVLWNWRKIWK